jgi:hypothetical protein
VATLFDALEETDTARHLAEAIDEIAKLTQQRNDLVAVLRDARELWNLATEYEALKAEVGFSASLRTPEQTRIMAAVDRINAAIGAATERFTKPEQLD